MKRLHILVLVVVLVIGGNVWIYYQKIVIQAVEGDVFNDVWGELIQFYNDPETNMSITKKEEMLRMMRSTNVRDWVSDLMTDNYFNSLVTSEQKDILFRTLKSRIFYNSQTSLPKDFRFVRALFNSSILETGEGTVLSQALEMVQKYKGKQLPLPYTTESRQFLEALDVIEGAVKASGITRRTFLQTLQSLLPASKLCRNLGQEFIGQQTKLAVWKDSLVGFCEESGVCAITQSKKLKDTIDEILLKGHLSIEESSRLQSILRQADDLGININDLTHFDVFVDDFELIYPGAITDAQKQRVIENIKRGNPAANEVYQPNYQIVEVTDDFTAEIKQLEDVISENKKALERMRILKNTGELDRIFIPAGFSGEQLARINEALANAKEFDGRLIDLMDNLLRKQEEALSFLKNGRPDVTNAILREIGGLLEQKKGLLREFNRMRNILLKGLALGSGLTPEMVAFVRNLGNTLERRVDVAGKMSRRFTFLRMTSLLKYSCLTVVFICLDQATNAFAKCPNPPSQERLEEAKAKGKKAEQHLQIIQAMRDENRDTQVIAEEIKKYNEEYQDFIQSLSGIKNQCYPTNK
ncbi:MAG: hypothetical protein ABH822_00475 [Patescibacteria group bacterium]